MVGGPRNEEKVGVRSETGTRERIPVEGRRLLDRGRGVDPIPVNHLPLSRGDNAPRGSEKKVGSRRPREGFPRRTVTTRGGQKCGYQYRHFPLCLLSVSINGNLGGEGP